MMSMLGVPAEQTMAVRDANEDGVAGFVRDSMRNVFRNLPFHENYFWSLYLRGHYTPHNCRYLTSEGFHRLKAGCVDAVQPLTTTLTEALNSGQIESPSHFVLLDHMDWMGKAHPQALADEWEAIFQRGRTQSRILWRSGGLETQFVDDCIVGAGDNSFRVADRLHNHHALAQRLHPQDRVGTSCVLPHCRCGGLEMALATIKPLGSMLRGRKSDGDHQQSLNDFYGPQADNYDSFRERLLHGRGELIEVLAIQPGDRVIELGGGTGRNMEFFAECVPHCAKVDIVDLCEPLLAVAKQRVQVNGWEDVVETHLADACTWNPPSWLMWCTARTAKYDSRLAGRFAQCLFMAEARRAPLVLSIFMYHRIIRGSPDNFGHAGFAMMESTYVLSTSVFAGSNGN